MLFIDESKEACYYIYIDASACTICLFMLMCTPFVDRKQHAKLLAHKHAYMAPTSTCVRSYVEIEWSV
jgi:hypothetical protein